MKKLAQVECLEKVILLNERIYTDKELGVSSDKIEQVDLGHRFTFKDIFDYIESSKIKVILYLEMQIFL